MPSTIRFVRQYLRPVDGTTVEHETTYHRGSEELPATIHAPAGRRTGRALPGWIVLHGLTVPGRSHRSLVRFARAVARSGSIVMVPEIPEWRKLQVAPAVALQTIRSAVHALQQRDDVDHGHVGLIGFSFGATQAIIASADPDTARLLHGTAAWGGYGDLRRVCRFGLTGLHELDGVTYQMEPDPYGAWIMGGNYLPHVPGYEGSAQVARALYDLAMESGERGFPAWDPVYDPSKVRLRQSLPADQRAVFDLVAPPTNSRRRDTDAALAIADAIAETALRLDPLLDPQPFLGDVRVPVTFAHGRDDRLIPFSESIRLARTVKPRVRRSLTVTSLFQHSGGTQAGLGPLGMAIEGARFLLLLRRVLTTA